MLLLTMSLSTHLGRKEKGELLVTTEGRLKFRIVSVEINGKPIETKID
jgi:hypothetical protein